MNPILGAQGLKREFSIDGGMFKPRQTLHAVNGVDLSVQRGEVLGIVGESGCGKSTLARMLLGLTPPTQGTVTLDGQDIRNMTRRAIARRVQPVFQDPYSSLNPRRTVADIVAFPLEVHGIGTRDQRRKQVAEMLECVGLSPRHAGSTPGQLSGGQRQRVAIARALVMHPDIVVCDEPTSALDVSVQAQILNLLLDLRVQFDLTYVFISHNLAVVEHIASHVAVMYLGRVVEYNRTRELFHQPRHPYTQALLASVLTPDTRLGIPDIGLGLSFPDPIHPPPGCTFHPRCGQRLACCDQEVPLATQEGEAQVACHLYPQTIEQGHAS
ncbi:ATP-binding cassette domain-containing protein [Pusillimonas sp. SM2304]|uniref:ABC transporter ATP-binding protein n=1 Tax=Pusillimonas sp. SM2304 TaxID=3073241 RepID=UPI0028759BB1|nr:oligopeptide/dipeptide ABC transporter ATP-binding protein [Pusillimonas sp. SM2304]MDS1141402.1 ATP-binding cassette domain-containing protein [Pusillimonas sp. SM2304]